MPHLDRMDLLRAKPFPELQQSLEAEVSHAGARRLLRSPAWLSRATAVAAILALVIGVAWWWTTLRVTVTMYQTAKGEQRTVALPDGSIIELNTDTALAVHLSGQPIPSPGAAFLVRSHLIARQYRFLLSLSIIGQPLTLLFSFRLTITVLETMSARGIHVAAGHR